MKKTCPKGHTFYKTGDCPVCEKENRPKEGFMAVLSAPARRAIQNMGIKTLKQLAGYSEKEVLSQHGIGRSAIPPLRSALKTEGLSFKK